MRTINKHANRRLYDAGQGRTITLLQLSDIVVEGESVCVVDKATGEDITAVTLLHSLLERLKRGNGEAADAREAERILAALRKVIGGGTGGTAEGPGNGSGGGPVGAALGETVSG